jgi:hypothetical protein
MTDSTDDVDGYDQSLDEQDDYILVPRKTFEAMRIVLKRLFVAVSTDMYKRKDNLLDQTENALTLAAQVEED